MELGNLLENFKTDILGTMGSQLDAYKPRKGKMNNEKQCVFSVQGVE